MLDADSKKFFFRFIAIVLGSLLIVLSVEMYQKFSGSADQCDDCDTNTAQSIDSQ